MLKTNFRRARKSKDLHSPVADRIEDIVIPEYVKVYKGNSTTEKFLLGDSGNVQNRILIFGR